MVYVNIVSPLATYANFPEGSSAIELTAFPAATVPVPMDVRTPVVALMAYVETSLERWFPRSFLWR